VSKLGDRLRRHSPEARAVHADGRWWTYGELVAEGSQRAAAWSLGPGDVVAIRADRGIEPVFAVCAAALANAALAVGDLDPAALRPKVIGPGQPIAWEPVPRDPRTALIIFTSGTTASPKAVVWSEARLAFDLATAAVVRTTTPGAIAAPLSTSFGLKDLILALYRGQSTVLVDVPFPWGLEEALRLGIERIKLTPTHALLALGTEHPLSSLRQVLVGAAPISSDVLNALAQRMPAARVGRIYGTTEVGAISVSWRDPRSPRLSTVGRPLPRRSVTIRDRAGRVQPPETWGHIVVDVPVWDAPDGYLDAPPELARRFANGRLWTGDRGKLDRAGHLVLGARASELIKVGGRTISAPAIERALGALGVEVGVVGIADPLLGQVPAAGYVPGALAGGELVAAAKQHLRADERPRWWLAWPALPVGSLGKLDRRALTAAMHRWTSAFRTTVALDFEVLPARELDADHVIADLGPATGTARSLALVARANARVITHVEIAPRSEPRDAPGGPAGFTAALRELAALLP